LFLTQKLDILYQILLRFIYDLKAKNVICFDLSFEDYLFLFDTARMRFTICSPLTKRVDIKINKGVNVKHIAHCALESW